MHVCMLQPFPGIYTDHFDRYNLSDKIAIPPLLGNIVIGVYRFGVGGRFLTHVGRFMRLNEKTLQFGTSDWSYFIIPV